MKNCAPPNYRDFLNVVNIWRQLEEGTLFSDKWLNIQNFNVYWEDNSSQPLVDPKNFGVTGNEENYRVCLKISLGVKELTECVSFISCPMDLWFAD